MNPSTKPRNLYLKWLRCCFDTLGAWITKLIAYGDWQHINLACGHFKFLYTLARNSIHHRSPNLSHPLQSFHNAWTRSEAVGLGLVYRPDSVLSSPNISPTPLRICARGNNWSSRGLSVSQYFHWWRSKQSKWCPAVSCRHFQPAWDCESYRRFVA